jgi:two-component system, LuxR family, sensor kinase FixL
MVDASDPVLAQVFDLARTYVCDSEGRVLQWSRGMERSMGFSADEAVGQSADALLKARGAPPWTSVLADPEGWRGEVIYRTRDDRPVRVYSRRQVLPAALGEAPRFVAVHVDLRRAELAGATLLADIVNGSDDAIIAKTLDGTVISWNPGAERIFGYAADEMIGQPLERLFPPELYAEEADILARLAQGERIDHFETTRLHKSGSEIAVSITVSPLRDDTGRIVGASKIARDITEQKLVRARLEQLQSELFHVSRVNDMGQVSAGLAHELNQPLSAISNYISGVQNHIERGDYEKAKVGCERAAAQVTRAGEVIRRLRNFVEKTGTQKRAASLSQIIAESRALAMLGSGGEGLRFETKVAADAAIVLVDTVQIQQVLVNLLRNAAEAMAASPVKQMSISTRLTRPGVVEVSVSDTGPGLSEQIRTRLFQPFATTKDEGMGVGLSICRSIVEMHGGHIWAESNGSGGVTFRFTVPSAESRDSAQAT